MARKSQPQNTGQASKAKREQRRFWHSLAVAMADGVLAADKVVGR
jgi:hypothetical protein